ncbi:MAG: sulfatase [Bryobacterales bacterium]|nr:sulfatase [Bryobacterales bacterium]
MAERINRREWITSMGVALAGCSRRGESRPNILFVLADDMSYPHAGAYGDKAVKTPAFDRVAREGVLFTNSYCASPSCTPSRSAILTGRQIWQVGEAGVLYGTIPPRLALFPHLLEDSGYFTGYTGKGWGPGDWRAAGLTRNPTGREYNERLHAAPVREGIDPRDYAANFEQFLKERPQGKPFFFWLGSTEPHRIYARGAGLKAGKKLDEVTVPAFLPDTKEVRSDLLDYYMEVEWFDEQLGRALDILKSNELDRTMIVVTSDNGMPFPRAKANLYDCGTRMPLAIRWRDRIAGGRRIEDFVSHIDFAPTFLEAAGMAVPEGTAGGSLLRRLEGNEPDRQRDHVYTAMERHTWCRPDGETYPMRGLRTDSYLYIRNFAPERWPTGGPDFVSSNKTFHGDVDGSPTKDFMADTSNEKKYAREYELCFGKRPPEELYDVAADPYEVRNLAEDAEQAATLARLRGTMEAYLRKTGDPLIDGNDPWQAYAYRQTTGFGASFNSALPEEERRKAAGRGPHKPE